MFKLITFVCALVIITLISPGCSKDPQYPDYQREIRLELGGYGYEVGDIVLIDTQKEPALGDMVQYDWELNNSSGGGMGPSLHLAKIIGLPGDYVSFQQWSYEANGNEVTLERYYKADGTMYEPQTKEVMWATQKFDNVAGMKLKVPVDEFLSDKRIGLESLRYNRFTVKRDSIKGIILKKLGHDKEFEKEVKGRVY